MAKRYAFLLAAVATAVLVSTGPATAAPVSIHDDSKVLDVTEVTNAATALPDPVQIFTTEKNSDDKAAFDNEAQSHVTGPKDVVIAINTKSKHLAIRTGTNSHIRDTRSALAAFKNSYGSGNYTAGTIAALNSLKTSAEQAGPGPSRSYHRAPVSHRSHSGFNWFGVLCPLVIIGLIVAGVVSFFRRRNNNGPGGGGWFNRGGGPGAYPGGGFGPGYGGGGGGGMSAGMAGGLGAVGGGLLGYELGKMQGEREADRDWERAQGDRGGYDQGPQEWGGGGGDADFGGGGGNDGDF